MTLRIQRSVEQQLVVYALAGRFQAEHVPELLALLTSESDQSDVLMDLKHVKLVDRDVVRFLVETEAGGARLRNCSAYIREWIAQEKNAMDSDRSEDTQRN
jgi:anti-anti-sigma regulatory factor